MAYHRPIPDRNSDGKPSGLFSALVQAEKLVQVALILPCAAFVGWAIGDWFAHRMHQIWPAALGVILGGAAGLVYVVRLAMDAVNDPANADEDTRDTSKKGNDSKP